jgi:mitochondrial fission protein ELM1
MKDLAGFNRFGWLTGFTNYRFAVPYFAGKSGRAIYNDVDQIYLSDPAALFDMDMNGHGILAVSPDGRLDTSVMLVDCERMAGVWSLEEARRRRKNALLRKASAIPGLIGRLDPEWNARDEEYVAGRSKILHYTALHTQPWRPFPNLFLYQRSAEGEVWHNLERAADAAGFRVFGFDRPSPYYRDVVERLRRAREPSPESNGRAPWTNDEETRALLARTQTRTVLEFGLGLGANAAVDGLVVTRHDPVSTVEAAPTGPFDAVMSVDGLGDLPDGDVMWVLEELFGRARRLVCITVTEDVRGRALADGTRLPYHARDPSWWYRRLADCGLRHPEVHWRLSLRRRDKKGRTETYVREGGRSLGNPPKVWILTDHKPGHTTQSVGLAEALGWPYEIKDLDFGSELLVGVANLLPGRLGATRMGLSRKSVPSLEPPWPDVVIATGWRTAPFTRWLGKRGRGRIRTVQLGRKGGRVADHFDAVVSCRYFRLPPHPQRIETIAPLHRVSPQRLKEAMEGRSNPFGDAPRPHVALLVGGSSRRHTLSAERARRLGRDVRAFANAAGGSVFAVTSRRTGVAADALIEGLGEGARVWRWTADREDNPYLACLAYADVIVATGDSESMVAEAAASGKPLYIYPVPERPPGLWTRIETWVEARAYARPLNRRGTARPQRGLVGLAARLIARGVVQPRRDLNALHQALIEAGTAYPFGAPFDTSPRTPLREAQEVARKVRRLLGLIDV